MNDTGFVHYQCFLGQVHLLGILQKKTTLCMWNSPMMPLSLLSSVEVGLLTACPGAPVGSVEQGLQAGGDAVLLVRVEHGLILPLTPTP